MKLVRFGEAGRERAGAVMADGSIIEIPEAAGDPELATTDVATIAKVEAWATQHATDAPRIGPNQRLGPPVANPNKIVCIGLNYADHAKESGANIPREPVVFMKATTSLCGPNDNIIIPRGSEKTDWEVEFAIIIGRRAKRVSESEALDYVAGYTIMNDVSERSYQLEREGQWVKGKSCDTFAPLGPWLVTPDELPDTSDLKLWLKVNGEMRQNGSTSTMIFRVPTLISYVSQFMTLLPGDVISTGTPPGVGLGMKPPTYLKPGDVVELGIEGLGSQRQVCVAED